MESTSTRVQRARASDQKSLETDLGPRGLTRAHARRVRNSAGPFLKEKDALSGPSRFVETLGSMDILSYPVE